MSIQNVILTHKDRIAFNKRFQKTMRKLWSQSPYRNKALNASKIKLKIGKHKNGNDKFKVYFVCSECNHNFEQEDVEVDHIAELHTIEGLWSTTPFDENLDNIMIWLQTLFCLQDNLQVLCKRCHARKTAEYVKYLALGGNLL